MTHDTQRAFEAFTAELLKLSQKYGVVVECTGGISFLEPGESLLEGMTYSQDASSGDLMAIFEE